MGRRKPSDQRHTQPSLAQTAVAARPSGAVLLAIAVICSAALMAHDATAFTIKQPARGMSQATGPLATNRSRLISLLGSIGAALDDYKEWQEHELPDARVVASLLGAIDSAADADELLLAEVAALQLGSPGAVPAAERWTAWHRNLRQSKTYLLHEAAAAVLETHDRGEEALALLTTAHDALLNGTFWRGGHGHAWCRGPPPHEALRGVRQSWEDRWCATHAGIDMRDVVQRWRLLTQSRFRLEAEYNGAAAAEAFLARTKRELPAAAPWAHSQQLPTRYAAELRAMPTWRRTWASVAGGSPRRPEGDGPDDDGGHDDRQEASWEPALAWLATLEAASASIVANLSGLIDTQNGDPAWQLSGDAKIVRGPPNAWSEWLLFDGGWWSRAACAAFADTCRLLASQPRVSGTRRGEFIEGQATILRLRPGARLKPHFGITNERLTAHLGLLTSEGATLRVAHELTSWRAGEVLLFDDSYLHEAWHNGTADRYVLYVSLWHPGIPEPAPSDPAWYAAHGEWHPLL